MELHVIESTPIVVSREALERTVADRLRAHANGEPGITAGKSTGDGQHELVMRDRFGHTIGVLGHTGPLITDFAVRADRRKMGVGTALVRHACERCGCTAIRGPFTEDGAAFVKKVSA